MQKRIALSRGYLHSLYLNYKLEWADQRSTHFMIIALDYFNLIW